jgi:hypothetical protein
MAKKKSQVQKFREAAKEAGADESEERFNATLKDLAKTPREAKEPRPERTLRRGKAQTLKNLPVIGGCSGTGVPSHQNPKSSCPGNDRRWEQTCSNLPKRQRTYAVTKTDFELRLCVDIALFLLLRGYTAR